MKDADLMSKEYPVPSNVPLPPHPVGPGRASGPEVVQQLLKKHSPRSDPTPPYLPSIPPARSPTAPKEASGDRLGTYPREQLLRK